MKATNKLINWKRKHNALLDDYSKSLDRLKQCEGELVDANARIKDLNGELNKHEREYNQVVTDFNSQRKKLIESLSRNDELINEINKFKADVEKQKVLATKANKFDLLRFYIEALNKTN